MSQHDNGVIQIKALANNDTATWPDEFVKVYLNNCFMEIKAVLAN